LYHGLLAIGYLRELLVGLPPGRIHQARTPNDIGMRNEVGG
jgi:hypothetical protein